MVLVGAYTGTRPRELASIRCEDLRRDFVIVRGGVTGPKNLREREVPIVEKLEQLIEERGWRKLKGPLFSIQTPARALGNACERLGMAKLTPYDLRHFFVTSCVEAGVDVPTVALWAGHTD